MKRLLIVAALVLGACDKQTMHDLWHSEPKTRAERIEDHCKNVAATARVAAEANYQQSNPNIGGFWGGAAIGRTGSQAADAAYVECLQRNGIDPFRVPEE